MRSSVVHSFQERLEFSLGVSSEGDWVSFYRRIWPDCLSIVRLDGDSDQQRHGIDRIVILPNGREITIDEKIREKDFGDILLEEWSVADFDWVQRKIIRGRKVGWSLDPNKQCDYIAYAVLPSGVCYLFPFELLRLSFQYNLENWKNLQGSRYPIAVANNGYTTINVAVPWEILKEQIALQMRRRFARERIELPKQKDNNFQLEFKW